jgi:integrase
VIKRPRDILFFTLLARTGKRVSEVLSIQVQDIDFINKGIRFKILKKRSERLSFFPIDSHTLMMLETYIKHNRLIPVQKLFRFSRFNADYLVKRYGKKAGLYIITDRKISCHAFRHTFAKELMEITGNVKKVSDILDHSSTNVTVLYLNYTDKERREAIESWITKLQKLPVDTNKQTDSNCNNKMSDPPLAHKTSEMQTSTCPVVENKQIENKPEVELQQL